MSELVVDNLYLGGLSGPGQDCQIITDMKRIVGRSFRECL
jgi:hypothetical protein